MDFFLQTLMNKKIKFPTFIFFLSFILFSCATSGKIALEKYQLDSSQLIPENKTFQWEEIKTGIRRTSFSKANLDARYELIEIDLSNPDLKIIPMESKPEWMKSVSVKKFAKESGSTVAVNTTPFKLIHKKNPFSKAYPAGLLISDGKVRVDANERYSAIAFFKDKENTGYKAEIFDSQSEILKLNELPEIACGGFWTVLDNNEVKTFKPIKDIRCAVATKNKGKTLYIFTGLNFTYMEIGEFFKSLDAEKAMQFDGGNSTDLVVKGKSIFNYGIKRWIVAAVGFAVK